MSEAFQNLFPQGGPNTVVGRYFSGASYLYGGGPVFQRGQLPLPSEQ